MSNEVKVTSRTAWEQYQRINRMESLNFKDFEDYIKYMDAEEKIFDEMMEVSNKLTGVKAGRIVSFPSGGGYANYLIVKVLKNWIYVVHIPVGDAWHSPAVVDSKVDRRVIEKQLKFSDGMKAIFSKK